MSQNTGIEWCHDTLNPFTGCQRVSPACDNCFAADFARRFHPEVAGWDGTLKRQSAHKTDAAMTAMERAKTPRRIFCGSMTDFGLVATKDPDGLAHFLSLLYRVQEARVRAGRTPHAFIWLTKRPAPLARFFTALAFEDDTRTFRHAPKETPKGWRRPDVSFPGLWVGVTTEDQKSAEQRIPVLLDMELPELLFVSAEPLLGPLRLGAIKMPDGSTLDALRGVQTPREGGHFVGTRRLRWVIAGGETGHRARPSHPDWIDDLELEIHSAHLPNRPCAFFFKSWGAWGAMNTEEAEVFQGDMVAWMSEAPSSLITISKPVVGYRMAGKRGAKKNDAGIFPTDQQVPPFSTAGKDSFLP